VLSCWASPLNDATSSFTAAACLIFASLLHFVTQTAIPSVLITHIFDTLVHLQQLQPLQPVNVLAVAFAALFKVNAEVFRARLIVLLSKLVLVNATPPTTILNYPACVYLLALLRCLCCEKSLTTANGDGENGNTPRSERTTLDKFIVTTLQQHIFYCGKFGPIERQRAVIILAQICPHNAEFVHTLGTLLTTDYSFRVRRQTLDRSVSVRQLQT